MTKIGYALSSEEHGPGDLVSFAQRAEEAGFDFLMISDHYHQKSFFNFYEREVLPKLR